MICPRCKEKNSAETITCQSCGLKLKTICPRCKEPNKLGQARCTSCNLILIRHCPQCKAANFPNVKNCRKCGAEIRKKPPGQGKPQLEKIKKTTKPVQTGVQQPEQKPPLKEKPMEKTDAVQKVSKTEQVVQKEVSAKKETEAGKEPPLQQQPPPQEAQSPQPEKEQKFSQDNFKKEFSRNEASVFLKEILTKSQKGFVIGLCSPGGLGKSTITSSLTGNIKEKPFIWTVGQCEPTQNNHPYAFFRDLMCNLFGIPIINKGDEELKKSLKKIFETNLEITDMQTLNVIGKIIFNDFADNKETIEENRSEINESIKKVFFTLGAKNPVVMIVEDFEFIDRASFECIKYLLKNGFIDSANFLIVNHTNNTNLTKFFPDEISSKQFLLVQLNFLTNDELNNVILSMMNNNNVLPEHLKHKIFRQSKGLPIYVEQALWYLFQLGAIYSDGKTLSFNNQFKDTEIIPDISELLNHRLEMIEKISPEAEKVIFASAASGFKFAPDLIQPVVEIETQKMQEILQFLVNNGIFTVINQHTFSFKHIYLWQVTLQRAISEGKLSEVSSRMISFIEDNKIPLSSIFLARLAEYVGNNENMTYYYNNAAQESLFLGDRITYTDNLVKLYERMTGSELESEEKESAKLKISEQIGKVNYESNPSTAIKYLSATMEKYEQEKNNVKLIELSGYLSRSYELMGNYTGSLECAEKAALLTKKPENSLEVLLLSFPKVDAIFNLGRLQEVIITIQEDFLPALTKAISRQETLSGLTIEDLKTMEYEAEYTLARAFIFQGNKQAVDVLNKIYARAEKENLPEYQLKAALGQALFSIIQGNHKLCRNILLEIEEKGLSVDQFPEVGLDKLFIVILNNMVLENFEQARNICYSALSIAKDSRNYNYFSLLKILSGYFYQHFQYYNNAGTIYKETANYCSETKLALGALYAWYFAAVAEFQTGNPDKAQEIADKALDVSQKPNINNFITTILLTRLLAEIKIIRGDLESAQINIESILTLAESNDLHYLLIELYITLGKIYQESASVNKENSSVKCSSAYRSYSKAYGIAEKLENEYLLQKIEKIITNLNTFCKLSGITVEKQ